MNSLLNHIGVIASTVVAIAIALLFFDEKLIRNIFPGSDWIVIIASLISILHTLNKTRNKGWSGSDFIVIGLDSILCYIFLLSTLS